nr:serine/threonine-protein kinase pim-2-like [Misgurnus anguillicaudatus]
MYLLCFKAGYSRPLVTEVALMLKLKEARECSYVIRMIDWYEERNYLMFVLEYLDEWMPLRNYISTPGKLPEDKARRLMLQLVKAVKHCIKHGVFHNDIHFGNILVDSEGVQLKLIDFGIGRLINDAAYKSKGHKGAPEKYSEFIHRVMPKNVLDLGSVLYKMLHGKKPLLWTPIMDPTLTKMVLDLASPATKASISLDHTKPKALKRPFDCIRRGKVKTVPDPQPPVSSSNPSSKDSLDLASQSKVVKGGPEEPTSLFEDYLQRKKDVEHHVMLPHRADQAHPDATDKASLPIPRLV